MGCVVLPSETARLVYGYLVEEKLESIALQFLENSPYLTDCCHIVKSGFHFNTKFLCKDLHELLQEYSTIQNLVNKKVGLLPKTSRLYERIKLHCENISEIIDLILFWKCNSSINETVSHSCQKNSREISESEDRSEKASKTTIRSSNNSSVNFGLSVENSECVDYVDQGGIQLSDKVRGESESDIFYDNKCKTNDVNGAKELRTIRNNSDQRIVSVEVNSNTPGKYQHDEYDMSEVSKNSNEHICTNQSGTENSEKMDLSLMSNVPKEQVPKDGQVKVLRVEKDPVQSHSQNKNPFTSAFVQNFEGMQSSINMQYDILPNITSNMENIAVNENQEQIIVISIPHYKTDQTLQNEMDTEEPQIAQNMNGAMKKNIGMNNEIIFEDTTTRSSVPVVPSSVTLPNKDVIEKKYLVDENIITVETYLQNKDLIHELENQIKAKHLPESGMLVPVTSTFPTAALSTVIIPETIPNPDTKYRTIMPKIQNNDLTRGVLVQPLVENNKMMHRFTSHSKSLPYPARVSKCPLKRKTKTSGSNSRSKKATKAKTEAERTEQPSEPLSMPSIRTPAHEPRVSENMKDSGEKVEETRQLGSNQEPTNEGKENMEGGDKSETPAVVVNRNPKRLSLSTPRRRSHIRALEFETPTKTASENKKKSKTSPKTKVEDVKVKNKNVCSTLFKSPDLDTVFKTPSCRVSSDKNESPASDCIRVENTSHDSPGIQKASNSNASNSDSPRNKQQSENLPTSIGSDASGFKGKEPKKSWDADLRSLMTNSCYFSCERASTGSCDNATTKERKPKKEQTAKRKKTGSIQKNQSASPAKSKPPHVLPSPGKMNLAAKRNTYSISGNKEGSPVRSILEELDLVTPFKEPDPSRSAEETPLTKLFRENVNSVDIDLSMITTPVFPPTPSIRITPEVEDSASTGTSYYSPLKDNAAKERSTKKETRKSDGEFASEQFEEGDESADSARKKGMKETHDKAIGELVSKAKEIVGLRNTDNERQVIKKPPTGKVLSMVKIQMITQCNKKLCENIPINEESNAEQTPLEKARISSLPHEAEQIKFDLKDELEEKRQRALRKITSVKENLTVKSQKGMGKRSPVKRKGNGEAAYKLRKKVKVDSLNESGGNDSVRDGDGEPQIFHSTPNGDSDTSPKFDRLGCGEKVESTLLDEIREEFPPFRDSGEFLELPLKTRKKLYYIKHFLKFQDVVNFLDCFDENKSNRLRLKRSHRKFFQVFYKWLKHPHAREVNVSETTKSLLKEYRNVFDKIKSGFSPKLDLEDPVKEKASGEEEALRHGRHSDDDDGSRQMLSAGKKEEEGEDGAVSTRLPLKKRKAPPVLPSPQLNTTLGSSKTRQSHGSTPTQNFLQDIDVDRFLSQIHGHDNR